MTDAYRARRAPGLHRAATPMTWDLRFYFAGCSRPGTATAPAGGVKLAERVWAARCSSARFSYDDRACGGSRDCFGGSVGSLTAPSYPHIPLKMADGLDVLDVPPHLTLRAGCAKIAPIHPN